MKLYNTLTGTKEEFQPINPGKVGFYACGPTVYDYAHIGNLKTFIFEDVLRRFLEYFGYEVRYIMNITDVGHLTADDVNQADSGEDKMLKAALREKKTPEQIANFYTDRFFEDIDKLNFIRANYYPKASAHIPQMIRIISELIDRGLAYEVNGNVFYDVEKFSDYGKLSKKKLDDLKSGARLEEHPDKKRPYDFALWLKATKEHLIKYESPWGIGYPGWHIECSAMSMEYLGETLDIHTGGEDHIFPHHENEIAQSEGFSGKDFSRFWLHSRFLLVDGEKMSKSKGNYFALKDVLEKGYNPMEFRLFVLSAHYRSNLNFSWSSLDQARTNLERITGWINNMNNLSGMEVSDSDDKIDTSDFKKRFVEAMNDDLNTPLALSVLYELITFSNKLTQSGKIGSDDAKKIISLWENMNKVFGIRIDTAKQAIPENVSAMAEERRNARINKDFLKSDELRKKIEELGFMIEDLKDNQFKLKSK
jgi:cysteinyl-tRNA synthetase